MADFWEFAKLVAILGAIIIVLILVLISLPGSRLREVLLKLFSTMFFTITGLLGLYILSPLDFIPDIIPLLGQLDDTLAGITALVSAIGGVLVYWQSRPSIPSGRSASTPRIGAPKDE